MDVSKLTTALNQTIALANLGGAVVQAGAAVVEQVLGILRAHSVEVDTTHLDELIADIERRRQLAAQESQADA